MAVCASCAQFAANDKGARGLCKVCYRRALYRGTHIDFPRRTWSRDELMTEWDHLRRSGVPWHLAHERLGMTAGAFQRAYYRARAAGDRRAIDGPGQIARLQGAA